ncbi:MAG: choice-of-anchor D domain-containing protein, partial [Bdellovibrionales bacterium]|nr:choice-of-anchor D domain-containing protein [Bdellovibrionales bacterium]
MILKNMTFKILALSLAVASCTPQADFYKLPKPAALEYGQLTVGASESNWTEATSTDFGRRPFGSTSRNTVHIKNTGELPAKITHIWLESTDQTNKEHFKVSLKCAVVESSKACPIDIDYNPNTVGATPVILKVAYQDGAGELKKIALPIKASASNLAFLKFEHDKLDIKANTIGYTLSSYYKVLYNGSSLAARGLTIEPAKGVALSDPSNSVFKIDRTNSTCGDVIQADCVIKVDFSPAVVGAVSGNFNLNYFNGAEVLKITGITSGTGLKATVLAELNASTLNFGNVVANPATPVGLSLPINFAGSVPAENVVIYWPVNTVFSVDADKTKTTCSTTITGTCALFIKFNPTRLANESGEITIEYTSNGQVRTPLKIALQGKGVTPALISTDVSTLAFGAVPAFKNLTKKFTLANSGEVAVSQLSAISLTDTTNFSGSFESKCSTLSPGATCLLSINLRPKTSAAFNSDVAFSYFDGKVTKRIILNVNGSGTSPLVLEGSRTIDFGNVMIGKTALPSAIATGVSIYGTTTLSNAGQLILNPVTLNSPFAFTSTTCNPPLDPKKSNSCTFNLGVITNSGFAADTAVTQNFTMSYKGDDNNGEGILNFTAKMTPRVAPSLAFTGIPDFKIISVNPLSEEGNRRLLETYIASENHQGYIKQYKLYVELLEEEFDM